MECGDTMSHSTPEACDISAGIDELIRENAARQARHTRKFEANRPVYDRFYDALKHLDPADRTPEYFEALVTVQALEQESAEIAADRSFIVRALEDGIVHKARTLGAHADKVDAVACFVRDFTLIRQWRRAHMDRIDCDLVALMATRRITTGAKAPLLDRMVVAWCKAAKLDWREVSAAFQAMARGGAG